MVRKILQDRNEDKYEIQWLSKIQELFNRIRGKKSKGLETRKLELQLEELVYERFQNRGNAIIRKQNDNEPQIKTNMDNFDEFFDKKEKLDINSIQVTLKVLKSFYCYIWKCNKQKFNSNQYNRSQIIENLKPKELDNSVKINDNENKTHIFANIDVAKIYEILYNNFTKKLKHKSKEIGTDEVNNHYPSPLRSKEKNIFTLHSFKQLMKYLSRYSDQKFNEILNTRRLRPKAEPFVKEDQVQTSVPSNFNFDMSIKCDMIGEKKSFSNLSVFNG